MPARSGHKLVIIAGECESRCDIRVANRPRTRVDILVIHSFFEIKTNRLALELANQGWIVMSTAQVCERRDETEDFTEVVRALPGSGECCNSTRAATTDGVAAWIGCYVQFVTLCRIWDELFDQEAGIPVIHAIIFNATVVAWQLRLIIGGWNNSRVCHDTDSGWHFPLGDKVVDDVWKAVTTIAANIAPTILKDHQRRRFSCIVLRRDVDPDITDRTREHASLTGVHVVMHHALWNTWLRK